MKKLILVVLMVVGLASIASAEEPKTLKRLQQEDQFQKVTDSFNKASTALDALVKSRQSDCIKAIGYTPFCDCILKDLPVAWEFADYIAITTRSKEQNGYDKLDAEYRAAYDKVSPIRDKCVQRINKKP
mgnify:CR=1 FL=1